VILSETASLTDLRKQFKRRIRQLAATSSSAVEDEIGNMFSDNAIADAINKSRRIVAMVFPSAREWCKRRAVITTVENVQEYSLDYEVRKILSVLYDTESTGIRKASTYEADDVGTREMEEACLTDAFNTPGITNPKYRIANKGVRLIVSTTGTVPADKYVQIEYVGEPAELTTGSSYSGWPGTLNDIVIDQSIWLLANEDFPEIARVAGQNVQLLLAAEKVKG